MESKYLVFNESQPLNLKTKVVTVMNKSGGTLGSIKWHGAWRKYIFSIPASQYGFIFDVGCLTDINNYIMKLMDERKNGK